jgi:hypothetical protein
MSLRSLLIFSFFLVSAAAGTLSAGDVATAPDAEPDRPQSSAALSAMREYDKSSRAADDAWRQAKAAADRKLIDKLHGALTAATKAGNLKEANAINAQVKAATARIEAASPPNVNGGLVVKAIYMAQNNESKAADVTKSVLQCVRGNTLEIQTLNLPDPASGVRKELVILGVYGGVPYMLRVPDGGINGLILGPAPANAR